MKYSLKSLNLIAVLIIAIFTIAPASASVLLGTSTLDNLDDLTVIQDGSGNTLEFLDLWYTAGGSVSSALSTYGSDGFHWATGAEVSELFDAFGIAYSSTPDGLVNLGIDDTIGQNFVSYLGAPGAINALGWLDDLTSSTHHTYACISYSAGCGPLGFVYNTDRFWPEWPSAGVYLVRGEAGSIPEPATLALLGLGLAGLGFSRRRKS